MVFRMRVDGYDRSWQVRDVKELQEALAWRDARGGAIFWLSDDEDKYPAFAMRVSGDLADVHFFPKEGHPGFRGIGGEGLPADGSTRLVFQGCDPGSGEETPNDFILPFPTASSIATEFFLHKRMSSGITWLEL